MYHWEVNTQFACVSLERVPENTFSCDYSVKEQASEILFISDGNYIFSTSEAPTCLSWHHKSGKVKWSTFPALVSIRLYAVIPMCLVIWWTYKTLLLWSVKRHQSFFPLLYITSRRFEKFSLTEAIPYWAIIAWMLSLIKFKTSFFGANIRPTGL